MDAERPVELRLGLVSYIVELRDRTKFYREQRSTNPPSQRVRCDEGLDLLSGENREGSLCFHLSIFLGEDFLHVLEFRVRRVPLVDE